MSVCHDAIAILDTVFKTIDHLGGSINSDLSVKIRGDIVRFVWLRVKTK